MFSRLLAPALIAAAVGGGTLDAPAPATPTEMAVVSSAGILRTDAAHTDPGRLYQFGSVSKTITAAAVEAGDLPLTTPVAEVLPALRDTELAHRGTTLADLLEHTSGLPHDITLTDGDGVELSDVADQPPGERGYRYSSLNYVLLQAVLEETGPDFATVAPGVVTDGDVPAGSVPFLSWRMPLPARHDPTGLGYGYLAGDITTLADFAARQLAEPSTAWRQESVLIDARAGTEVTTYRHSGAVPGYFAHVTLVPELDRAVVLLTAYYGETEAQRLGAWADNIVRAELGGQVEPLPAPSRLSLWLMMACLLPVLALALRPRRWVAVFAVLIAVVSLSTPYVLGYPLHILWPWAPDIAAAVVLWSALWLLAAGIIGFRWRYRHPGPGPHTTLGPPSRT